MKRIILTQSKFAKIDDKDYDFLSQYTWHAKYSPKGDHWYAYSSNVKGKRISMHRLLMNPPKGLQVDHGDNDGLNNQRYNLKNVTKSGNRHNLKNKDAGISFNKVQNKWVVRVRLNKVRHYGGYHFTFEEAREARDQLRKKLGLPSYFRGG